MFISYDYSKLINELNDELKTKKLSLDSNIKIIRGDYIEALERRPI